MRRLVWSGMGLALALAIAAAPACSGDPGGTGGTGGGGGSVVRMGMFACGPSVTCDGAKTYCYHFYVEGAPPEDDVYECRPYPSACETQQTCACLEHDVGTPGCPSEVCDDNADGLVICEVQA